MRETIEQRTVRYVRATFREHIRPRTDFERQVLALARYQLVSQATELMLDEIRRSGDDYLELIAADYCCRLRQAVLDTAPTEDDDE